MNRSLGAAFVLSWLLTASACDWTGPGSPWHVGEMSPLDQLSLKMSSRYKRELDRNDYSLFYEAEKPNTIVLRVRYRRKMDQSLLREIITAAEDHVRFIARDQFKITVTTRVDSREVEE